MNPASQPKQSVDVTVVTVCYNALDHLRDCIASVMAQRHTAISIEHLLIDGNSTDGTQEYLQHAWKQSHISCFISEPDHGIYDAMNKGLALAQGRVIVFLNADDEFQPGAIRALATPILTNKTDYTIGTARIRQNGKLTHYLWPDPGNVYMGAICCHQTLFCKTDILRTLGGFDGNNFPTIADGDLMANLAANHYKYCEVEGEHVIFNDGGASADCIITAADQYARLIIKYWPHLHKLIQTTPEHFYRVRWDIGQKINHLNRYSQHHTVEMSLMLTLHRLQQELEQLTINTTDARWQRQFSYLCYRFLSKISFGKKRLSFLQRKYFAKQKIKWHRI